MSSLHKLYLKLLFQNKGMVLLGILLAVITAFSGIALLAVSGWFISAAALAGLTAASAHAFNFFTPGALVRGLSISRTTGRYAERVASHEATLRIISTLRSNLFRMLSRRNWQEQQLNRHEFSSRLLQDIQHIEHIYLFALVPAIVSLCVVAAYMVTLWMVLPGALPIILPLLLLVTVIFPWLYSLRVQQPEQKQHKIESLLWLQCSATFSCIRTLTLSRRLPEHRQTLLQIATSADEAEYIAVKRQQQVLLLTQLVLGLMSLGTLWLAIASYSQELLTGAEVFMLLLLTLGTADVLINSCPAMANLALGIAALERLESCFQEIIPVDKRIFSQDISGGEITLQIRDLSYTYPQQEKPTLVQFNFEHHGGGWFWLQAPSGVGKSTLLHLICGELQPQMGQIQCQNLVPSQIGLQPQRIDILRASLRDNLSLHNPLTDQQIWQALTLVELSEWANNLPQKLETWLGDGEWQPSGGEAKRLGLARLILQDPQLILLDEPSAGLDSDLTQKIFTRLARYWQDRLVICSSHDLQFRKEGQPLLTLKTETDHLD
ncbi:amino acid ABC transporter ATP-binding/permease protein [uncultured Neptuniibacter sp.]|uniref:amino acid ABC transporter ATP-binding/permease protein n=1 Tax=uncultured Neptuniibacter sp. TaxID=502143 RepID=UPI00260D8B60|nr:ATP-binding cassette domain-containing protein [uncultured Neptuniibacter sp.]